MRFSPFFKFRDAGLVVSLAACLIVIYPMSAKALPFNDDMVGGQNRPAGSMMRAKAAGSIPMGASERFQGTRDEARTLVNPIPADRRSLADGKRLYAVNCSPCHGGYKDGQHEPGTVSQWLPGTALGMSLYANETAYPDGHFYQFIHFGGLALMPAYGYKLSNREHWDIVNYIRYLQSEVAAVEGR